MYHFIQPTVDELMSTDFWNMDVILADDNKNATNDAIANSNNHDKPLKRTVEEIMRNSKRLKTQGRYTKAWNEFIAFSDNPVFKYINEDLYLQYFDYLIKEKKYCFSTLWSTYSMLNSESQIQGGPKLNIYYRLINLIKGQEKGYQPKQSLVFSSDEIEKFLEEAPSSGIYLLYKAALMIGNYGGLRCIEMAGLLLENFKKSPDGSYWVTYNVSKQRQENVKNTFHIPEIHASHIEKYVQCLTESDGRMFRTFVSEAKNNLTIGRFIKSPMGKNTLAKIPQNIASYLGLKNKELYTGHCFRRTSATLHANGGATSLDLKKHFNWRSENMAMRYVNQSSVQKTNMSAIISGDTNLNKSSKEETHKTLNISNCSNFVIHL